MKFHYDKYRLSPSLKAIQKEKGTYDSPCLSICDYDPDTSTCQTCSMKKLEKTAWKKADSKAKEILASAINKRISQKD